MKLIPLFERYEDFTEYVDTINPTGEINTLANGDIEVPIEEVMYNGYYTDSYEKYNRCVICTKERNEHDNCLSIWYLKDFLYLKGENEHFARFDTQHPLTIKIKNFIKGIDR